MRRSQGATLAITLIFLFVITLIGVTTMQVTHLQEKMTSNLQDKELSFNASESALTAGESWLLSQTQQPSVTATCSASPCVQEVYQDFEYTAQTNSWWQANASPYASQLSNIATSPRYFIEFLQFASDSPTIGDSSVKSTGVFYYQITSRGTGATDNSESIIQTTLGRRY